MKRGAVPLLGTLIGLALIALGWWLVHDKQFDVLSPAGETAIQQRNLIIFTVSLIALIVVPVYFMLATFAWKYSDKNKKAKYDPKFTKSVLLESIWWGIPIAIIGILAVVTYQTSHSLDPYREIASDQKPVKVQVIALQWKWLFLYPEHGIATVNQIPIPQKTPIEFQLSADAPMSAFWVPALGSQIYAMNGMTTKLNLIANQQGDFKGYSTNINGEGYSRMKLTVHSWNQKKFDTWVKESKDTPLVMDEKEYSKLSQASMLTEEKIYRLADKNLYNTILSKYMNHGAMGQDNSNMEIKDGSTHGGHH